MKIPKRLQGKHTASHARSPQQEAELAKRTGGRVTRGSGCGNEKGDVRIRGVARIEAKTTKHKSFSVTQDMLDKIEEAAMTSGELPALVIEFIDGEGKPKREVAVVPTWVLDVLTQPRK
jgi:hypothetical protein